jgi:ribonuclease E
MDEATTESAVSESLPPAEVETPVEIAPDAAVAPAPVQSVAAEPIAEPEPVLETVAVTAEPDPAEITDAPAKPRRGWWRRS